MQIQAKSCYMQMVRSEFSLNPSCLQYSLVAAAGVKVWRMVNATETFYSWIFKADILQDLSFQSSVMNQKKNASLCKLLGLHCIYHIDQASWLNSLNCYNHTVTITKKQTRSWRSVNKLLQNTTKSQDFFLTNSIMFARILVLK